MVGKRVTAECFQRKRRAWAAWFLALAFCAFTCLGEPVQAEPASDERVTKRSAAQAKRFRKKQKLNADELSLAVQTRRVWQGALSGAEIPVPKGARSMMVGYAARGEAPEVVTLTVHYTSKSSKRKTTETELHFPLGSERWHDATISVPTRTVSIGLSVASAESKQSPIVVSRPAFLKPRRGQPKNLILISVDTLRADYLTVYGYDRYPTSPRLDAWAKRGTVLDWAIAPSPWTIPSHSTLLTGLDPDVLGMDRLVSRTPRIDERFTTLAELFSASGFLTVAFTGTATLAARHGFIDGFYLYQESTTPTRVQNQDLDTNIHLARTWLSENLATPFFMFFHTFEAHAAYTYSRFVQPGLSDEELPEVMYASDIAYTDERLGGFLADLGAMGALEDTLVVIVADHGEGFESDHGVKYHGKTLYDEVVRVPLIMVGPKIPAGQRIAQQRPLQDVYATLADYFDLQVPEGVTSKSMRRLIGSGTGESRPAYLCCMGHDFQRHGVRADGFKYVISHPTEGESTEELYDLSRDPKELRNLGDSHPMMEKLRRMTERRFRENQAKAKGIPEPAPRDEDQIEQLRALGYIE